MKRGITIALTCAALTLSLAPTSSFADMRTPPALPAGVLEQFKKDLDAFNAAMLLRDQKIREINQIFSVAVNKATQDARFAMQVATKPEQKISVTSLKKSAIASAIIARENAIIELGMPPVPPVDPLRAQKSFSKQRDKKEKSSR
jgi:hypothetical protein